MCMLTGSAVRSSSFTICQGNKHLYCSDSDLVFPSYKTLLQQLYICLSWLCLRLSVSVVHAVCCSSHPGFAEVCHLPHLQEAGSESAETMA